MRHIDFASVEASDGDFSPVPEGAYVCVVTGAADHPDREYFELVFDVAEGPYKGAYSDEWGKGHPFAHRVVMSYKDAAQGILKGRLKAISGSNPGFDAEKAYSAACSNPAMLGMFVGKLFGLSMLWEYWSERGGVAEPLDNPRPDWVHARMCTADEARSGEARPPRRRERNAPPAQPAEQARQEAPAQALDVYEDEIPF